MPRLLTFPLLFLLLAIRSAWGQESAPGAPCGTVDALQDPLAPLTLRYDDFGIYRARFGGLHVGVDMGFGEGAVGTPVYAVARGQVTYADPYGWDTEGGVIVLAHHFPDGSVAYSLYGHIVPEGASFPEVGRCVEGGTLLARIGTPTLSAPHLHFEFRDFLPDDGGPGYVPGNPLEAGWFHPLDFAAAWRLRLNLPARAAYHSPQAPTLPPVLLADGQMILASGNTLFALSPLSQLRWRLQSDAPLRSLAALPDESIVAHSTTGQVLVVHGGRYRAIWSPAHLLADLPPLVLGETLVFATEGGPAQDGPAQDGTLLAFAPSGLLRWQSEPLENARPLALRSSEGSVALLVEEEAGARLRLFSVGDGRQPGGRLIGEWHFNTVPLLADSPNGGWWLYDGGALLRLEQTAGAWQLTTQNALSQAPQSGVALPRDGQLHALADGGALLFPGDAAGTLLAFSAAGQVRWQQVYPELSGFSPPLLASAADGCWLAALSEEGALLLLRGADGTPLSGDSDRGESSRRDSQVSAPTDGDSLTLVGDTPLQQEDWPGALYPGGRRQRQPAARLLQRQGDLLLVGAGHLSVLALDVAASPELQCEVGG